MTDKKITHMAVDMDFLRFFKSEAAKRGVSMLELQREYANKKKKEETFGF
jgi:hypothetical protein